METKLILKQNEDKRLKAGHQWIFSNEIGKIEGSPLTGYTVELFDSRNNFLGVGFYNSKSLIAFRLLSRQKEAVNAEFFTNRIWSAYNYRKKLYPNLNSYRIVFGESDNLPGLVVDKYEDYLSVQFISAGMEKNADIITDVLKDIFKCKGIVVRNDSSLRVLEGLDDKTNYEWGEIPELVEITENGCKFLVDLKSGQKTGFFFDQKDNRLSAAKYVTGKTVLDCFSHTGGFGIYAAVAGAKRVVCIDSSEHALETARKNAKLNGMENRMEFLKADVEQYLQEKGKNNEKYDVVIIDPPGLIKNKKQFHAGFRLYKKLNSLAMGLVSADGILVSFSCSHHMQREDFRSMLSESAKEAGKQAVLLETASQAKDHPVLLSMPETEYLKGLILKVV